MTVETLVTAIVDFVREHEGWAVPVAFLVAFGESFCFLSLLWPGTAILAGLAALLAASGVSDSVIVPAALGAAAGGALGYAVSYWIGRYFKDSIHKIWPFSTRPHLIADGQEFFERYGAFGVFLGHFFGPVRAVIPVVAGMFAMPQLPFQIANILSALIWSAGIVAPAFYLVQFKEPVLALLREHEWVVALVLFSLALVNAVPRPLLFYPTLILFILVGALHIFAGGSFLTIWIAGAAGALAGDLYAFRLGQEIRGQSQGRMAVDGGLCLAQGRTPAHREPGACRRRDQQVPRLRPRTRSAHGGRDANGIDPVRRREPRLRPRLVGDPPPPRHRHRDHLALSDPLARLRQYCEKRVAAIGPLEHEAGTFLFGERAKRALEVGARLDRELREPALETRAEPGRQSRLGAEIDDVQRAARRDRAPGLENGFPPGRDHRQRVGDEDAVEVRNPKQLGPRETGRVPVRDRDPLREPRPRNRAARRLEHRRRDIEAEVVRARIAPRRENQIAPRAAGDLENAAAVGRSKLREQAVAAEEIVFAGGVVDVPLAAVDHIHMQRGAGRALGCGRRRHAART